MSEGVKILENRKIRDQIYGEAKYDTDHNRLTYTLTNKRTSAVEVRMIWSNLNNLEVVQAEQREIPYIDKYGRTTLQPGQSKVCAILAAQNPAAGFNYNYSVVVSEVGNVLPPVSRIIERTEIRTGIFVVANWYGSLRQMHLVVTNRRETAIRLKLVWTVFENMRILRGGSGEIYVGPQSEATYAVMTPRDRDKAWKYRYSFRMIENASEPTIASEIARDAGAIQQQLTRFKELFYKVAHAVVRRTAEASSALAATSTSTSTTTSSVPGANDDKPDGDSKEVVLPPISELLTNSEFLSELDKACAQQKIGYIDRDLFNVQCCAFPEKGHPWSALPA